MFLFKNCKCRIVAFLLVLMTYEFPLIARESATVQREITAAIEQGQSIASAAIEEHELLTGGRTFTGGRGVLVAEGDSWFDYPLLDTLSVLQWQYDYQVESVAHKGDTLESMAYDEDQFLGLVSTLKRLKDKGKKPKAILLSGGGNDIAGPELIVMLNHVRSGSIPLDNQIVQSVIATRLQHALITLVSAISGVCNRYFSDSKIPILIHGYDYPTPDGRGYAGGFWILPGPWLKPAFDQKGYTRLDNNVSAERSIMRVLLDEYNKMLRTVPSVPNLQHVHYVSIIGTFTSLDYKSDWANELHPTRSGFASVARKFQEVLQTLP